jgi:HD superfamily phosphohydrolase
MTDNTALQFKGPEFLTRDDIPLHLIRCPIHGFIHFSDNERCIINHPLFQRLRYIRQLALTEYIFPGATHTRFEHSLGVMELATRYFDSLNSKKHSLLKPKFAEAPFYKDRPLARARQYLRLAGLLHDIGHVAFSHAAERVTSEFGHEALTIKIIRENSYLGGTLDRLYGEGTSQEVASIIEGGRALDPQVSILHDIISSQLDADRTDYLLRDSHYCGVDYGRFDHRRLVECLELEEDEDRLRLALERGGVHTFEALICARYQMFTQVYCHRLRRLYDRYIQNYFIEWSKQKSAVLSEEYLLHCNDITLLADILKNPDDDRSPMGNWARRIKYRSHHKVVFETEENVSTSEMKLWKRLVSTVTEHHPNVDLISDVVNEKVHELLQPGQIESPAEEDSQTDAAREKRDRYVRLTIVDKKDSSWSRHVGNISQILGNIPHRFQCARLYADVSNLTDEETNRIRATATQKWREIKG